MDSVIEKVLTNGKIQNIQTILIIIVFGFQNSFIFIFPFLFKINYYCLEKNNIYKECSKNDYCMNYYNNNLNLNKSKINYDLFNFTYKFNLYCNNEIYIKIYLLIYLISTILFLFYFSYLCDKYGRLKLYKKLNFLISINYFLLLIVNSRIILLIIFILFGITNSIILLTSIFIIENLNRDYLGIINGLSVAFTIILSFIGYIFLKFFNIEFYFFILFLGSFSLYFLNKKYLHESPHWLICKNRINECLDLFQLISNYNNRKEEFDKINQERYGTDVIKIIETTDNFFQVFFYSSQKKRLIIHCILWFCLGITSGFYIIKNKNLIIIYIIMLFSSIISGYLADIYGRRKIVILSFYVSSIILFTYSLLPKSHILKYLIHYLIPFLTSTIYTILFIFSSEDFPTSIRGVVFGNFIILFFFGFLICYFIKNEIINIFLAFLNSICGRLSENLEETLDLLLDDEVPESQNKMPFKKKEYREFKIKRKSTLSDLYFLTSDDETFNREQIPI